MVTAPAPRRLKPPPPPSAPEHGLGRLLGGVVILVLLVVGGAVLAVFHWSHVTLAGDSTALAHFDIQPFGGSVVSTRAVDDHGNPVALTITDGRLTPVDKIRPGARITVDLVVKRPSSLGWLIGKTEHEQVTVQAPVAHLTNPWITALATGRVLATTDIPIVAYGDGHGHKHVLAKPSNSFPLAHSGVTGRLNVSLAARPWERVGTPKGVTYFPAAKHAVVVADPAPGQPLGAAAPLKLTFSQTVSQAIDSAMPHITPAVHGHWSTVNAHTIEFRPSGFGFEFGSTVAVGLPRAASVEVGTTKTMRTVHVLRYRVPAGSTLRLHQLLADLHYLPYLYVPSGHPVGKTLSAQTRAAADPPAGHFVLRFHHTPSHLTALWNPDKANPITTSAIEIFQRNHGMTPDGIAGPAVWRALIGAALAGDKLTTKGPAGGFSYVYVHEANSGETMTLWHNGHTIISSPANTGVPGAATELGTFEVFEHLPVTTMTGTNPDGTHYSDPGILNVSYFNGGDALHAFPRASYGTPQSNGCVELPAPSAATEYPYTDVGTLVTVYS